MLMGVRAFMKLGRDDEAMETARIAVSPEQRTGKKVGQGGQVKDTNVGTT